jgi:tRNAThr (cytosine32-N3)-methyltransferase
VTDLETRARAALDEAHAADPERVEGRPAETVYADRIESWIPRLVAQPSLALRLAARGQHLERWSIPRAEFPEGRSGYLRWRSAVHQRQGQRARELLAAAGGDESLGARVARLVSKATPRDDPEAQALEDAACLVFLENELADFQREHEREKVVDILRKTWKKMSPRGQDLALELALPAPARDLVRAALA